MEMGEVGAGSALLCRAQGLGCLPGGSNPAEPPPQPCSSSGGQEALPRGSGMLWGTSPWVLGCCPKLGWVVCPLSRTRGSCLPQAHRGHPVHAAAAPPPHRAPPYCPRSGANTAARPQVGEMGTQPWPLGCRVALPRPWQGRALPWGGQRGPGGPGQGQGAEMCHRGSAVLAPGLWGFTARLCPPS